MIASSGTIQRVSRKSRDRPNEGIGERAPALRARLSHQQLLDGMWQPSKASRVSRISCGGDCNSRRLGSRTRA
jgi:hypothetical protein